MPCQKPVDSITRAIALTSFLLAPEKFGKATPNVQQPTSKERMTDRGRDDGLGVLAKER